MTDSLEELQKTDAVFVVGSGPGTGKSTVAGRLHAAYEAAGIPVRCWYETDVLAMSSFGDFHRRLLTGDNTMVDALERAFEHVYADVDTADLLLTESLVPFVRWLVVGLIPETALEQYCRWLERVLSNRRPRLVVLECDADVGVGRARRDRGAAWYAQWRSRERNYPLYQEIPSADRAFVYARERPWYEQFEWPMTVYDTAAKSRDEIARSILGPVPLATTSASDVLETGVNGRYQSEDPAAPLREFEVVGGRITLAGTSMDLVWRKDGTLRIDQTNTVLTADDSGAVTMNSVRLGQIRFKPSNEAPPAGVA